MALPPPPKALRSVGAPKAEDYARRVDEWARGTQTLLEALRSGDDRVQRRLAQLEADMAALEAAGGGGSVTYGAHVDLTVGGSGTDGVATTVSRSDHVHGLPAFGTSAGTFAEGDHTHSGLGSGYVEVWDASAPNASSDGLHTDSDEFLAGSIDGSWTTWDHAGVYTIAADGARKRITLTTGQTATRTGGLYKAIPGSEFSVVVEGAAMATNTNAGGGVDWGIVLGDDLSVSTSDFVSIRASAQVNVAQYTSVDHSTAPATVGTPYSTKSARFLRLRVNGTTVHFDSSETGFDWHRGHTMTVGFTPVHYGVLAGIRTTSGGAPTVVSIRSFRVLEGAGSSAYDALIPGRLVRLSHG